MKNNETSKNKTYVCSRKLVAWCKGLDCTYHPAGCAAGGLGSHPVHDQVAQVTRPGALVGRQKFEVEGHHEV